MLKSLPRFKVGIPVRKSLSKIPFRCHGLSEDESSERMNVEYKDYRHLQIEVSDNGVVAITINRPEIFNAANARLHWEMGEIWKTFDDDPLSKIAVITGAGRAFSAGAELDVVVSTTKNREDRLRQQRDAAAIVENMIATPKPIISAINGVAVGAGLAVALVADISIIAQSAKFTDGHVKLGVAAGDHAAFLWPFLCGIAKAKYYLYTCDFIDGAEAERIGLVSRCVPDDELLPTAFGIAERLANASQIALHSTKKSINQWLRMGAPIFDQSLALEFLDLAQEDASEGVAALMEKRPPVFPSASKPFQPHKAE
jgi:enoyl-CoA hydratase